MACFEISKNAVGNIYKAVALVSPVVGALGVVRCMARWGGHIVSPLDYEGLLAIGLVALAQSGNGLVLGEIFYESVIKNYVVCSNPDYSRVISVIAGSLVAGGAYHTVAALALKAGLMSVGFTLPAAAALVIVPAVVEGASLFVLIAIIDLARSRRWIAIQGVD